MKTALALLVLLLVGCPAPQDEKSEVKFFLASDSPKVGFLTREWKGGKIFVAETPFLMGKDIFDVQPVFEKADVHIEVIVSPEAENRVKALYADRENFVVAVFVEGTLRTLSPISPSSREGLLVINGSLPPREMAELAQSMGHT